MYRWVSLKIKISLDSKLPWTILFNVLCKTDRTLLYLSIFQQNKKKKREKKYCWRIYGVVMAFLGGNFILLKWFENEFMIFTIWYVVEHVKLHALKIHWYKYYWTLIMEKYCYFFPLKLFEVILCAVSFFWIDIITVLGN